MQVLIRYSKYKNNFRCTFCGIWIPKEEAEYNKSGTPLCPECGRIMRTKSRKKRNKNMVTENTIENTYLK
ncbi:MAG: hypothetical protein QW332_06180 [Thermoproteota archaeon]